jgi:SAM-dependent methyltransferase
VTVKFKTAEARRRFAMVQLTDLERQLKVIGANYKFFGRPEIRELAKILNKDEVVYEAVNGYYEGGFALLVLTDHRLLLIDRKPMFLTLEDIRFDMISEVDFNHRLLNAMSRIYTPNKSLIFSSWNHGKLRKLVNHLQDQVTRSRQQSYMTHDQFRQYAQNQVQQPQIQPSGGSILPALAQTAMQGSSSAAASTGYMSQRFISPLSRNPYVKTPFMIRRKRIPGA